MDIPFFFWLILPIVALLYASVGHGGASGYLALMALFSFPVEMMRPTALTLNLFVAAASFLFFSGAGFFRWRLFLPFAITSVPAAFLGGMIEIDSIWYNWILAVFLLFAVFKILGVFGNPIREKQIIKLPITLFVGLIIGFFSGMIGIGGGIILSPVILLLNYGNVKETAAVTALFIWVNSASGLSGHLISGGVLYPETWALILVTLAGGVAGGLLGSRYWNMNIVKYALAIVLLMACVKLFLLK